ncbi:hypothetical protein MKK64_02125 [Methylobacterium sp. E-025]|uniref:hypothetical protein n=1 Tax=Methylobacterium sp. E-025 TaxID=2836561 RepID=UPI001FB99E86|nr:hypothetical protein [Methylobacterium sp. E-025]MCJ2110016.1 hypothetical protein [Methylobacterium sp. E-025]
MADNENQHLQAIARALNMLPEILFEGTVESETTEAATSMRLWLQISDTQGRKRVLSVACQEAELCGYRE